ncbi:MAG TPA: response regulator transcription factor [Acidimicrobiales bacterium]|nr:response regulator transcription factor [Acidimicrobiales bacterium]
MTIETATPRESAPRRVLVADDQASTRRFLRAVLEELPDLDVIGEAVDGMETVAQVQALQPDIVLLDLSMPVFDGSDAIAGILRVKPDASVVIVSGMDPEYGDPLVGPGVLGFVWKGLPPFELLERLRDILTPEGSAAR